MLDYLHLTRRKKNGIESERTKYLILCLGRSALKH